MTAALLAMVLAAPPAVPFDPPAVAACDCGAGCVCDAPCRCVRSPDPYEALVAAVAADGSPRVVVVGFPRGAGRPVLPAAWVGATPDVPAGTYVVYRAAGRTGWWQLAPRLVERVSGFFPDTGCYEVLMPDGTRVKYCPKGIPVSAAPGVVCVGLV